MLKSIFVACFGLLLAAPVQAQFIDCGPGGVDCSETLYGLGNDAPGGPFTHTVGVGRTGPPGGGCGAEQLFGLQGQIRLREQNSCVVSATERCQVEIPDISEDSGVFFILQQRGLDLGPLGLVNTLFSSFTGFDGNIGHRQLSGTCGVSGDECALDAECDAQNAGDVCASTCFSDPGTSCSSHADCPNLDCRTEIEWDGIGLCTGDSNVCTSDADCAGEDICLAGFTDNDSVASCSCCQSVLGVVCAIFGGAEYPALTCGIPNSGFFVGAPDWLFDGGRGTRFGLETIQVPGQQEGLCTVNRSRPCGAVGDIFAGSQNGKCQTGEPTCGADPFNIDNPALPSDCDDVAFGGVAGDVCDFTEDFIRNDNDHNADGTPNSSICPTGGVRLVGTPNELCALPVDIPEGDPQPGCRLINVGIAAQPDVDCSGVDDTLEGRCMPVGGANCSDPADCPSCGDDGDCASGNCVNNGDLCPFIGEANWFLDTNNDDIGDECQCGDGNGDGAITGIDIGAVAVCANDPLSSPFCDATIVDATGDNATTAEDIGGIVAAVTGTIQTQELSCVRNTDTTQ